MKCKYLILGGGPAGLTFANYLKENNATDFIVVEECDEAGGLCKSALVDGAQLDMGGDIFWMLRIMMRVIFYLNLCQKKNGMSLSVIHKSI